MTTPAKFTSVGVMWHGFAPRRISADARRVEELGYDSIWSGDHVLSYVDGLVAAGVMAAATSTVTVGTAVFLLPLRPTVLAARSLVTVQREAGARLIFGVGMGGDDPDEYAAVNVSIADRAQLFDDSLAALSATLGTGTEPGGHAFGDLSAGGSPRMWVGGRSTAAARRAGRCSQGLVPYLVTPPQMHELYGIADAVRAGLGCTGPLDHAVSVLVAIGASEARAQAAAAQAGQFGLSAQSRAKYVIAGPPEHCVEQLLAYANGGAEHLIVNLAVGEDAKLAQLDQFTADVLPHLRAA